MSKRRKRTPWGDNWTPGSLRDGFAPNTIINKKQLVRDDYLIDMRELVVNSFRWTLPDYVDQRFIETTLFYRGLIVAYVDPNNDHLMILPGAPAGQEDTQRDPTAFVIQPYGRSSFTLPASECVPIWGSSSRIPKAVQCGLYADRLAELDISTDIVVVNSRTPVLLVADDMTRTSVANAYRMIQQGEPYLAGVRNEATLETIADKIVPIDMGVKTAALSDLQIAKTRVFNEAMTRLGIDNSNQDKKERLVADEVNANDNQITQFRNIYLKARQRACELINAKGWTDVPVDVQWDDGPDNGMTDSDAGPSPDGRIGDILASVLGGGAGE